MTNLGYHILRTFILLAFILFIAIALNAQEKEPANSLLKHDSLLLKNSVRISKEQLPQVILPSPTVAELGKYGTIPVSHYTGIPQISIPIYTLQCGQLTLPISLSYHAGGIKVEQIASWVGLGWSLNAGGVISSNIIDRSDFDARLDIKTFSDIDNNRFPKLSDLVDYAFYPKRYDAQPDIYSYNFAGHTGQFVLDNNLSVHEMHHNKKIKITSNKAAKTFDVLDDAGNIYIFSEQESTSNEIQPYNYFFTSGKFQKGVSEIIPNVTTAWFLSKLISADRQDTIKFIYENETIEQTGKLNGKIDYNFSLNTWQGSGDSEILGVPMFSIATTTNKTKRLKTIEANNGVKIEFTASLEAREDLPGSKQLEKITISTADDIVKRWSFNYTYFRSYISHTENEWLSEKTDNAQNNRLRLASVIENEEATHTFDYYGDANGEPAMPYRTAYCGSDFWGYCNGKITAEDATNPKKLFTNLNNVEVQKKLIMLTRSQNCDPRTDSISTNMTISYAPGSDKTPKAAFMNAYSLKTIHYPTQGYSRFIYEPNQYSMIGSEAGGSNKLSGGLRIKTIQSGSDNDLQTRRFKYKILSNDMKDTTALSSGAVINEFSAITERWASEQSGSEQGKCGYTEVAKHWNLIELSSSSYTSMYSYAGDYIGYAYVQESDGNGSVNYNFYSINDFPNKYKSLRMLLFYNSNPTPDVPSSLISYLDKPDYPFLSGYWGKAYGRGLMRKSVVLNNNNKPVQIVENEYDFMDKTQVFGMEIIENRQYVDYLLNIYYHQTGLALLTKEKRIDYDTDGLNPVQQTVEFKYNRYNQVSQKTTSGSDVAQITKYTYPPDISGDDKPIMKKMTDKYIISPLVAQEKFTGGETSMLIDAEHLRYTEVFSGIFRPTQVNRLETTTSVLSGGNYDALMKPIFYYDYNEQGKVISAQQTDGVETTYQWKYAGQYPVVKIDNAATTKTNAIQTVAVPISEPAKAYEFKHGGGAIAFTYHGREYLNGWKLNRKYEHLGPGYVNIASGLLRDGLVYSSDYDAGEYQIIFYTYDNNFSVTLNYNHPYTVYTENFFYNGFEETTHKEHKPFAGSGYHPGYYTVPYKKPDNKKYIIDYRVYSGSVWEMKSQEFTDNMTLSGNAIDEVRVYSSEALMTTYTYKPLIGMTSETDPSGRTIFYEYDTSGRLCNIKDEGGNILKTYRYHYKQE